MAKRPRVNYKKLATEYILTFGWAQAFSTEAAPGEMQWLDERISDLRNGGWDEVKYERLLQRIQDFVLAERDDFDPHEQEVIDRWYAAQKGES